MAPSKKHDAVEAAKIATKPSAVSSRVEAPPPSRPDPAPVPVAAKLDRYRVKATTTVSLFGQIVTLPIDSVISASGYGPDGMQRILDSNVPLEKLE